MMTPEASWSHNAVVSVLGLVCQRFDDALDVGAVYQGGVMRRSMGRGRADTVAKSLLDLPLLLADDLFEFKGLNAQKFEISKLSFEFLVGPIVLASRLLGSLINRRIRCRHLIICLDTILLNSIVDDHDVVILNPHGKASNTGSTLDVGDEHRGGLSEVSIEGRLRDHLAIDGMDGEAENLLHGNGVYLNTGNLPAGIDGGIILDGKLAVCIALTGDGQRVIVDLDVGRATDLVSLLNIESQRLQVVSFLVAPS